MNYTITPNAEYNSLEISFDGKPAEAVRDAMKALKFRWHNVKKVWYGYADEATARAAIEGKPAETPAPKMATIDKNMLRGEFAKACDSEHMVDFCVGKVAAVAILPDGGIVTVDKQPIETRFCFGESGYDFDDAQRAAIHARESADYFKRENMEHFRRWVKDLQEAKDFSGGYALVIYFIQYTGQSDDCKLRSIGFERMPEVIDACGGSACLEELPGRKLSIHCRDCHIATSEEVEIILDAYKTAEKAHEKKVDAYLKRYGLSKVHTWTYWRDA